jgi:hypothetical protein
MDAEDWLCTVERELHTAQCDDREKVLYGPRLLRGVAQSWWESYLATMPTPTPSPGTPSCSSRSDDSEEGGVPGTQARAHVSQ